MNIGGEMEYYLATKNDVYEICLISLGKKAVYNA